MPTQGWNKYFDSEEVCNQNTTQMLRSNFEGTLFIIFIAFFPRIYKKCIIFSLYSKHAEQKIGKLRLCFKKEEYLSAWLFLIIRFRRRNVEEILYFPSPNMIDLTGEKFSITFTSSIAKVNRFMCKPFDNNYLLIISRSYTMHLNNTYFFVYVLYKCLCYMGVSHPLIPRNKQNF
jgi:hypothetical protein